MTDEYTLHLIDEREFRHRFLPAIRGDEDIVREILEAADAAGPSWTYLHKLFERSNKDWTILVQKTDGPLALRTIFADFAQVMAYIRPAYAIERFGLSLIELGDFPELTQHLLPSSALLRDHDGRLLEGVPPALPGALPPRSLPERSGGVVLLKERVRPFLKDFRGVMPRLADRLEARRLPAEQSITMLLTALVEAKLKGYALYEAHNVLTNAEHLPKDHKITFGDTETLPPAVLRESGRLFGKPEPAPKPSTPKPDPKPSPQPDAVAYSPQSAYEVGQRLHHKAFGTGQVIRVLDSRRLEVSFDGENKTLAQNLRRP